MTMSDEHEHHDHAHDGAGDALDAGSQALAEALRSSFAIVKIVMVLMVLAFFSRDFSPSARRKRRSFSVSANRSAKAKRLCSARACTGRFRIRLTKW
jgi:hypothetical protein